MIKKLLIIFFVVLPSFGWFLAQSSILVFWLSYLTGEGVIIMLALCLVSFLGVLGLFFAQCLPNKQGALGKLIVISRANSYVFMPLVYWLPIFLLAREAVRAVVQFIAINVTRSGAFEDSLTKFEWDAKLQVVVYMLYVTVLVALFRGLLKLLQSSVSNYLKRFAILAYILICPAYVSWGVHSVCAGWGGCAVGYHVDLVAPLILSTNPLYALLFVVLWAVVAITLLKIARFKI